MAAPKIAGTDFDRQQLAVLESELSSTGHDDFLVPLDEPRAIKPARRSRRPKQSIDEELASCEDATGKSASSEDIFYAMMNGEAVDASHRSTESTLSLDPSIEKSVTDILMEVERDTNGDQDDCSFSGLDLPDVCSHGSTPISERSVPKERLALVLPEDDSDYDTGDNDNEGVSIISDISGSTEFFKNVEGGEPTMQLPSPQRESRRVSLASRGTAPTRSSAQHTTVSNSGSTANSSNRKVRFDTIQIRYYERILEINPAVTDGPAIGIGWRYKRGGTLSVKDWELRHQSPQEAKDLLLSRDVRINMLREMGYQQSDIANATRMILKAKHRRQVTVQNLGVQNMEEVLENGTRKFKGLFRFSKKKILY